ncbi:enoyl-CoA hydratase/isomerase family protein [Haloarchaeobius litoreus]|uniref:Enoyl-CoA hydratase/isomerase family protein n=1 Tax=Haloarchaeobius litoreus TaxID=755306 RepID=A0ABD6DQ38_9EURY|nr:enoyl-CoA hydratase/isomerase family protein [Haloarchaeobius litoreus]
MIETAVDGGVTRVMLSRPTRRNAFTEAGLRALRSAVTGAETPVVLLTGAGDAFSAGADLAVVAGLDREGAREFARLGQSVATAIEEAEAVVVAGIDGPARGGGVELALACDVRVATPRATFAETGVSLGLFGAWGGTARLPRVVGEGEAMDLALSGRTVDADEALRMGLVSRVVDEPAAVAAEIAANDPAALPVLKRRMRDDADQAVQHAREADAFADLVEQNASDLSW